jgi:hypothetical protein
MKASKFHPVSRKHKDLTVKFQVNGLFGFMGPVSTSSRNQTR